MKGDQQAGKARGAGGGCLDKQRRAARGRRQRNVRTWLSDQCERQASSGSRQAQRRNKRDGWPSDSCKGVMGAPAGAAAGGASAFDRCRPRLTDAWAPAIPHPIVSITLQDRQGRRMPGFRGPMRVTQCRVQGGAVYAGRQHLLAASVRGRRRRLWRKAAGSEGGAQGVAAAGRRLGPVL